MMLLPQAPISFGGPGKAGFVPSRSRLNQTLRHSPQGQLLLSPSPVSGLTYGDLLDQLKRAANPARPTRIAAMIVMPMMGLVGCMTETLCLPQWLSPQFREKVRHKPCNTPYAAPLKFLSDAGNQVFRRAVAEGELLEFMAADPRVKGAQRYNTRKNAINLLLRLDQNSGMSVLAEKGLVRLLKNRRSSMIALTPTGQHYLDAYQQEGPKLARPAGDNSRPGPGFMTKSILVPGTHA